jgi:4-alpha-glucanotransferase
MAPEPPQDLRERASALGVATGFSDGSGRWRDVSEDTLRAVLDAIGEPAAADPRWPAGLVCHAGRPHPWKPPPGTSAHVVLESGDLRPLPDVLPGDLPAGYHTVTGRSGHTALVVAPRSCYLPPALDQPGRAWGWAAQLYAVRSRTSWGIGDLGDLATLAADQVLRGDFVLINPLNEAPVPDEPGPYRPSSRIFRSPLYLDVEQVPERSALTGISRSRFDALAAAGRGLTSSDLIDRTAVHRIKDEALRLCYAAMGWLPGRRAEFCAWRAARPLVDSFATFRSLQGVCGTDWRSWPAAYRDPDGSALAGFRREHADEVGYQAWLQWLLEAQLAAIPATRIGVISDFPVGLARGGFDAWQFQGQMAARLRIGAPPDAFAPQGQNWGLTSFAPHKLAAGGYEPLAQSVRAAMTGAGGLRIDHVMGIFRLFLIPEGAEPLQGTYVRFPAEDLLGIIALESHRARALVVGEDLGNVEPGVRDRLAAGKVLSSRVVWFETDPGNDAARRRASDYPRQAVASVATHDLPTVTGCFTDSDLHQQHDLGLIPPGQFEAALAANQRLKRELLELLQNEGLLADAASSAPEIGSVVTALHAFLARTPAMLVALRLEDAIRMRERPNLPGTTMQARPQNWRLPLPVLLEDMRADLQVRDVVADIRSLLPRSAGPQPS